MSASLILAELQQADRLNTRHIEGFTRDGVDLYDLAQTGIRADWIVAEGDGRFEFRRYAKGGVARSAFIFPVWNSYGDLADLCAWRPGRELATWLGRIGALGEEQVDRPRLSEPLRVYSDPLSWFRAKRQGIVIVDFNRAADVLRNETLGAEDLAHARLLKTRLTIAAPSIIVTPREQPADPQLLAAIAEAHA